MHQPHGRVDRPAEPRVRLDVGDRRQERGLAEQADRGEARADGLVTVSPVEAGSRRRPGPPDHRRDAARGACSSMLGAAPSR